ncbi:MAG TPA: TIGR03435 family protein [Candidatus Sulfopaludibacter sp.]|nr:TIGR03435 family protein [Candidatus Sulfopaludibacter sp.]
MKIIVAMLVGGLAAMAQTPEAKPSFEVASVKLGTDCNAGRGRGMVGRPSPGRLNMQCATVESLIQGAYIIFAHGNTPMMRRIEITGGPAWMKTEMYTVAAKAEGAATLPEMYGPMLQALLEERFKLKLHTESREVPVYALTLAKGGSKLKPTPEGSCVPIDWKNLPAEPTPGQQPPNFCGNQRMRGNGKTFNMSGSGLTMADIVGGMMSNMLDRPVIDKTGLAGRFDFELEFAPDSSMPMFSGMGARGGGAANSGPVPAATDPDGPTVFMALEKLGLKLEKTKGPVDVIVIDHIERPTDN